MCNFQEHLFYGTPPVAASIFKKLPFSVLIFSDENNIAKLAFDMWGNCSSRLWYSLETYNSFLKSLQYRCLPVNFPKFLKTSFLQKTSEQLVLYFFYSFYCFAPGELIETSLSIFGHVLSQHSNVMNIMNLNNLLAAVWKHTFLGDITWNLAVFWRLISISIVLTEFLCFTVLQLFTHGTPKRQIKSKMTLEKAVILRCSVKKTFWNIY